MINTRYASDSYDVGPAVIRALSSLTHDHADKIAEAVEAGAPDWEVDRVDDPDGYVAVFVSLKDDMDAQPTYLDLRDGAARRAVRGSRRHLARTRPVRQPRAGDRCPTPHPQAGAAPAPSTCRTVVAMVRGEGGAVVVTPQRQHR